MNKLTLVLIVFLLFPSCSLFHEGKKKSVDKLTLSERNTVLLGSEHSLDNYTYSDQELFWLLEKPIVVKSKKIETIKARYSDYVNYYITFKDKNSVILTVEDELLYNSFELNEIIE